MDTSVAALTTRASQPRLLFVDAICVGAEASIARVPCGVIRMRKSALFAAGLLAASVAGAAPAEAALLEYSFAGNGIGCRAECRRNISAQNPGGLYATFALDPALVDANGNFSFDASPFGGATPQFRTLSASIAGDTLSFFFREGYGKSYSSEFAASLTFRSGTLGTTFPSSFSFDDVISSSFQFVARGMDVSGGIYDQFGGSLLNASVRQINGTQPYASYQLVGSVPEPGTWALMLLGFGAIGYSMRRRRTVAFA